MAARRNRVRRARANADDLLEAGARRPAARLTPARSRARAPRPLRRAVRAALRAARSGSSR
ncbi:hypothetical protein [Streptodolium elevatio]